MAFAVPPVPDPRPLDLSMTCARGHRRGWFTLPASLQGVCRSSDLARRLYAFPAMNDLRVDSGKTDPQNGQNREDLLAQIDQALKVLLDLRDHLGRHDVLPKRDARVP